VASPVHVVAPFENLGRLSVQPFPAVPM